MWKVEFSEIKNLILTIWCGSEDFCMSTHENTKQKEYYWYERAWKILEKEGLTSYDEDEEEYRVYLRAIALNIFYLEFCEMEYGEDNNYQEFYDTNIQIPPLILAEMFANIEKDYYTEDLNYMLTVLAMSEMKNVKSALMKSEELYFEMISVTTDFINFNAKWDEEEKYNDDDDNNPYRNNRFLTDFDGFLYETDEFRYIVHNYDEFWKLYERDISHYISFDDMLLSPGAAWLAECEDIYEYMD